MPTSPTEEFLKLIWTRRLYTNRELATCDGRPLRVISHGNINPVAGTDITDAQIEIDGTADRSPYMPRHRSGAGTCTTSTWPTTTASCTWYWRTMP